MFKRFYQAHLKRIPLIRELVTWGKHRLRYFRGKYQKYAPPTWTVATEKMREQPLKWAAICDEFTLINLQHTIDAVYLSPSNWREKLEENRPSIFFCEATWEGIKGEWGNEICRDYALSQENRVVLKDILKYCREAGVQTIFWNKEDTPKFDDAPLSFIDTALLFDHIFTTASECIPKYQALGHSSVHLMMFGYSPELFRILTPQPQNGVAVFLGSWYEELPERCEETCRLFDMVLEQGLKLRIYDRASERQIPGRQFPERYRTYILPAVSYEKTAEIMSRADYVINVNSVKDSETMFARRVFEAMACGRIVISNDSTGLKKLFPNHIWFPDYPFDRNQEEQIIAENLETVRENYTFRVQLAAALNSAGIPINI